MPIDLRQYARTSSREWMDVHDKRLEKDGKNLSDMISAIVKALMKIPSFKYFDIEKNVKSENREVFVKNSVRLYRHLSRLPIQPIDEPCLQRTKRVSQLAIEQKNNPENDSQENGQAMDKEG